MNQDPSRDPALDGLHRVPVLWLIPTHAHFFHTCPDTAIEPAFGPGRSRKIKSWGHDADGVHWLATRSGTPYHTDPNYARYTHHLVLRNDGFRIRGFSDEEHPPMVYGTMYCLDTHSPHHVIPDDRLTRTRPLYKVQLAVDRHEPLDPPQAWQLLIRGLTWDPAATAATATLTAPRYNPPKQKVP